MTNNIKLAQIESTDLGSVKNLVNGFRGHLAEHREVSEVLVEELFGSLKTDPNSYLYAIKVGGAKASGVCGIQGIDWISGHGDLFFIMQDLDSPQSCTIPNSQGGHAAFEGLLRICFDELGLNKVTLEVAEGNEVKHVMDKFGFVAEGIRRQARFKSGKPVDTVVCSLLAQEWECLE